MLRLKAALESASSPEATSSKATKITKIGGYTLLHAIGSGSFGKVYLATNDKNQKFAVKLEIQEPCSTRLLRENQLYCLLLGSVGIPRVHWFGHEQDCTVLVLDALGPSLDDLFHKCSRRFSLKTVLMLADQLLNRLELLHSKFFVHRDVKPANFVIGTGLYSHIVYMIDFGLAERFCDYRMLHNPNKYRYGIGTPLFSSTNTHFRNTPSRRDDLESISYMLIFFLKGSLPWEGIKGKKASQTWELIAERKLCTTIEDLCDGLPHEFSIFLEYCRKLEYDEKPDYECIRGLFRTLATTLEIEYDCEFDWVKLQREECARASSPTPTPPPPPGTPNNSLHAINSALSDLNLNQ